MSPAREMGKLGSSFFKGGEYSCVRTCELEMVAVENKGWGFAIFLRCG
jgi:hypothetical protein